MNKSLRIVFYGTPSFATAILDQLHHSHHEIVAVVTAVDKPAGRGRKINESDVKKYAVTNGIDVLQPKNLKAPEFIDELKSYNADLQVIVAFRMLPEAVWSMPTLGTFNLHASLLPQYRGAAPINWAIINGEKETGVTTFFIDDKIDTGAIIAQSRCGITSDETVGSLYIKLQDLGKELTLKTVNDIATGIATSSAQENPVDASPAPKLNTHNTTIDWTKSAVEIDRLVRGLFPFPIAKALLSQNDKIDQIKIHESTIINKEHEMMPGTMILVDTELQVACGKDLLHIKKIQLPNKKAMLIKDLLNGYEFHASARMVNREP